MFLERLDLLHPLTRHALICSMKEYNQRCPIHPQKYYLFLPNPSMEELISTSDVPSMFEQSISTGQKQTRTLLLTYDRWIRDTKSFDRAAADLAHIELHSKDTISQSSSIFAEPRAWTGTHRSCTDFTHIQVITAHTLKHENTDFHVTYQVICMKVMQRHEVHLSRRKEKECWWWFQKFIGYPVNLWKIFTEPKKLKMVFE